MSSKFSNGSTPTDPVTSQPGEWYIISWDHKACGWHHATYLYRQLLRMRC